MKAKIFTLSLLLLALIQNAYSQFNSVDSSKSSGDSSKIIYDVSARLMYSVIMTGQGTSKQFMYERPWAAQVDLGVLKNTQKTWNYCNCYTNNGVSVGYYNFDNSRLGSAFTTSFFAEPIVVLRKNFAFSIRGNAGFAYLTKIYDSITNPENTFVSTRLSYYLAMGFNASYRLNKNFILSASAQYNHISNADRKDPNEGLNFSGVNIGVSYVPNAHYLERKTNEKFTEKNIGVIIHAIVGGREAYATSTWHDEKRFLGGANVGLIKRVGRMNAFGVGGEFYYDGINNVLQQRSGQTVQTMLGGVSVQHYLFLGKLLFGQQFARFVTPNTGYDEKFYQRYFLEYEVTKNWYAGVSLKSHGAHSDYLALSTGYFFKL